MEDLLGSAVGLDRDQEIAVTVKIGEGCGAGVVGLHTDTNGLRPIIFTLIELATAMVADTGGPRRARFDMENGFTTGTGSAAAQPAQSGPKIGS